MQLLSLPLCLCRDSQLCCRPLMDLLMRFKLVWICHYKVVTGVLNKLSLLNVCELRCWYVGEVCSLFE